MTQSIEARWREQNPGWNPPFTLPEGVDIHESVVYGTGGGRELRGDLFLPFPGEGRRPAMLFLHGGGWHAGSRAQFYRQAARLAAKGVVGLCAEYRLSPEAIYPAAVEDAKCAVRWLRAFADDHGIDPERIGTTGSSAGGHLAAMLATTADIGGLEGDGGHADQHSRVQVAVLLNPAIDMRFGPEHEAAAECAATFLGGRPDEVPDVYTQASPITHVSANTAPCLIIHGTADTVVPYEQATRFRDALLACGGQAELMTIENGAHGLVNANPHFETTYARMEEFLLRRFDGH